MKKVLLKTGAVLCFFALLFSTVYFLVMSSAKDDRAALKLASVNNGVSGEIKLKKTEIMQSSDPERTPAAITADSVSKLVIDGREYTIPCTLDSFSPYYDVQTCFSGIDKDGRYNYEAYLFKDGFRVMSIYCFSDKPDAKPDEIVTYSLHTYYYTADDYRPCISVAGVDTRTPYEEAIHLLTLDENEYFTTPLVIPDGERKYVLDIDMKESKPIHWITKISILDADEEESKIQGVRVFKDRLAWHEDKTPSGYERYRFVFQENYVYDDDDKRLISMDLTVYELLDLLHKNGIDTEFTITDGYGYDHDVEIVLHSDYFAYITLYACLINGDDLENAVFTGIGYEGSVRNEEEFFRIVEECIQNNT